MLANCGTSHRRCIVRQALEAVVVEHPLVYPGGKTKDPNSIVKLSFTAGLLASASAAIGLAPVHTIFPRQWKGTIDAETCCRRTYDRLSDTEVDVVHIAQRAAHPRWKGDPDKIDDNMLDAIGI